jgi:prepilin-type N-terminal cleavage/methylation domain-containing protein
MPPAIPPAIPSVVPAVTRSAAPFPRRAGFTIVEILVVVGIIAVLLALVSVALRRGGETARQTAALTALKEIGRAWTLYGNQSDDRCLPGYIDVAGQQNLKIKTRDVSGEVIDPEFCTTYALRLLPYLDFDRKLLYDYILDFQDTAEIPLNVIRDNPAFGYNAYYVGGWHETDPVTDVTRVRFTGSGYYAGPGTAGFVPSQEVVARTTTQIEQPSELVTFASSTAATPGFYKNSDEAALGAAWVVPPKLGQTQIWQSSSGNQFESMPLSTGPGSASDGLFASTESLFTSVLSTSWTPMRVQDGGVGIEVLVAENVPLRRIRNFVQTVRADGSTAAQTPSDLMNMRRWVSPAYKVQNPRDFSHP